jgi:hypothetical protein
MSTILAMIFYIGIIFIIAYWLKPKRKIQYDALDKPVKKSRAKHPIKAGMFEVTGYHHLSDEMKLRVWKEMKVGDELTVELNLENQYDNEAIKVLYGNDQIGWVSKRYEKKSHLFNSIKSGAQYQFKCVKNSRRGDTIRVSDQLTGEWGDKYMGMAQFVDVEFTRIG